MPGRDHITCPARLSATSCLASGWLCVAEPDHVVIQTDPRGCFRNHGIRPQLLASRELVARYSNIGNPSGSGDDVRCGKASRTQCNVAIAPRARPPEGDARRAPAGESRGQRQIRRKRPHDTFMAVCWAWAEARSSALPTIWTAWSKLPTD